MALTIRPFAFNPGGNIAGTLQVGDLTIGTPTAGFAAYPSIKFWNGPLENGRIVVCYPDPVGLHTGADGERAFIGFRAFADEAELIAWTATQQEITPTTANQAYDLLLAAGIWTSYVRGSDKVTGTLFLASEPNGFANTVENCGTGLILTETQYWHNGDTTYPGNDNTMWQDAWMVVPAINGWYLFKDGEFYAQVIDGKVLNATLCAG
tara:strand:+ start:17470 stop:18093 length:624 start_codon:yes stop_codon:yes gene_type:complete